MVEVVSAVAMVVINHSAVMMVVITHAVVMVVKKVTVSYCFISIYIAFQTQTFIHSFIHSFSPPFLNQTNNSIAYYYYYSSLPSFLLPCLQLAR